jgi:AraC-like DNA-binding protein
VDEYYGRFYVKFSAGAFASIRDHKPKWIFETLSKKTGLFRVGVYKKAEGILLSLRFHVNIQGDDHTKFRDVILHYKKPVAAMKPYCVEFYFKAHKTEGGAQLWINDTLADSSFGHITAGRGPSNRFSMGAFSWAKFDTGHIIIDEVVLSKKRIGPKPRAGDLKICAKDSAASVNTQLVLPDQAWFLAPFTSGIVSADFKPMRFPAGFELKTLYQRFRVRNRYGVWSAWSSPYRTSVDSLPGSLKLDPSPVEKAWFTPAGSNREKTTISPGEWVDINIKMKTPELLKQTKGLHILQSHFQHPHASPFNDGDVFWEKSNYYFSLDPEKKLIWCRSFEETRITYEVSGQKHTYVNDDQGQFAVDNKKGTIKLQVRLSENALLGPWRADFFTYDKEHNRLSQVFIKPFVVSRETEIEASGETGGFKLPVIILFILLGVGGFFYILIYKPWPSADKAVERDGEKEDQSDVSRSYVERSLDIIKKDFQDAELSMEKVASQLNISRSYLSSQFKTETGKTFPQTLNEIRMEKAKDLLKTTDLQISEVAFKVGYGTYEHFNASFRKTEGISPSEFRKNG